MYKISYLFAARFTEVFNNDALDCPSHYFDLVVPFDTVYLLLLSTEQNV